MALQRSTSVHVHTCLTPWVVLLASSGLVTVKIHSLPAIVLLVVIALSFVFQVHSEQCSNEISLRARFGKTSYARWTNTSTTLICSGAGFTSIMWYSVRTVYKMAVGCLKNEHEELHLDWFPDVPEIIATYISYQRRIRQVCIFSSSNGILSANLSQENLDDNLSNVPVTATLYFPKNSLITNVFFICKQGEVRNGTCRSQMSNGTFYNGEKSIYTNDEFYKITYEVVPTHMGKHEWHFGESSSFMFSVDGKHKSVPQQICVFEITHHEIHVYSFSRCFARINGTYYVVSVIFLSQSYQFSQDSSSYRFMKDKMCGSDMCIQAANQGHLLCDAGIDDCYKMDNTYGCDSGVPLIDSCEVLAEDSNWTCPQISGNYSKILDYGRSVRSIAYNAKTLYRLNPDYILNFTSKLTDSEIRQQLTGSSSSERHSLALHLLHSMRFALNESPSVFESSINWSRSSSDFPSTSLTKKLQAAGVFLHLIAEIARQTPTLINTLASGEENQNNLRLLHLRSEDTRVSMNNSYGNVLELFAKPKGSEARDAVVAVIPTAKIPGIILTKVDSAERKIDRSQLIGSDIVLVDTSSGVSFTVSVDLSQKPNVSVSCEQLQRSAGFTEMWNEGNCKTVVVGLYFECQCLPSQDGTFAVALVYWLGVSHIPFTHVYSISIVNYIFTLITIVALFLFLIFTRFIGIFRLDQFNIAFCLMISSVVSLTIPHTTDKQPILCTMIAVAVCYFPLAAFSWKFIFGLNTLVLIVAPHSRFHDLVSKPKNCISLVWIGYLTPAVIIGIWFGYTGEISNGGLCIGPKTLRWSFIGPITAVVTFNFVILLVVGFVLLRNYFLTRKSKLNKTTHLLVLTQLMLTLGIPYIAIYIQLLDAFSMLIVVPVAMALTAVLMFILVAIVDEENRLLLRSFIYTHITRPNEHSGITTCKSKCEIVSNSKKPIDNSEITFDLSNYLAVQTSKFPDQAEGNYQYHRTHNQLIGAI